MDIKLVGAVPTVVFLGLIHNISASLPENDDGSLTERFFFGTPFDLFELSSFHSISIFASHSVCMLASYAHAQGFS